MEKKGLGLQPDRFKKAIERYGVWPVTVWDCNYTDPFLQKLKLDVGDVCSSRQGTGTLGYQSKNARSECLTKQTRHGALRKPGISIYAGKITESIFNPLVALWALKMFGPSEPGTVYDPFAGGGTRAILSAKLGHSYVGVEIRQEEVDSIMERCRFNEVGDEVMIITGSSAKVDELADEGADFLLTCPPYWNLERYEGGEDDLSMAGTYEEFLEGIRPCIQESFRILKPGAKACWVVGMHRDKDMTLLPIHHDISRIHTEEGFKMKEEVILHLTNTGAIRRVGNFDKGGNYLIRTHEYLLVFVRP